MLQRGNLDIIVSVCDSYRFTVLRGVKLRCKSKTNSFSMMENLHALKKVVENLASGQKMFLDSTIVGGHSGSKWLINAFTQIGWFL